MKIFNKNGINISIDDDVFFKVVRGLPKEKQVELVLNILEYDGGEILKSLAKKRSEYCDDWAERFKGETYEFVRNKYKGESEIWKEFLNLNNLI